MPVEPTDKKNNATKVQQVRRGTQSVQRAMTLLKAVAEHNKQGANLSRLARKVGLHVATARRLLQGLVEEGIITYDPITKLYNPCGRAFTNL